MHFHVNGSTVGHSSVHDPAHSSYLYVISAAQPHTEKGATPIRLSEANTSTPGAADCILGHNNDILSPHDDGLLDRERTAESLLITLESDPTAIWMRLVLMALCVYYLLHLIKLTYFKRTSNSLVITFYPVVEVCWCQDKSRGNFFTGLVCSELHHHCHTRNRSKYVLWLYCWWFSLPLFIRSGTMCKVAVFLLIENVESRKTRPYTHIQDVLRGG